MKGKSNSADHISVTEFKAKCLKLFEETGKKGKEFTITKKGEPIAKVVPIKKSRFGSLRGSLKGIAEIKGDIVNFDTSGDWEVLKE